MKITSVIAILLTSFSLFAQNESEYDPSKEEIYMDAKTGLFHISKAKSGSDLRVTPDMARALSRSSKGLKFEKLANGAEKLDLKGRFKHVTTLVIKEDGTRVRRCSAGVNHNHSDK